MPIEIEETKAFAKYQLGHLQQQAAEVAS